MEDDGLVVGGDLDVELDELDREAAGFVEGEDGVLFGDEAREGVHAVASVANDGELGCRRRAGRGKGGGFMDLVEV